MNRPLAAGIALIGGLAIGAAAAPGLSAAGLLPAPLELHTEIRLQGPGPGHWLGTDGLGRDVLSRLLHGARPSLTIAVVATLVSLAIGVPAGALAGLRGGFWDLTLTRLMEATRALPSLPLILLVVSLTLGGDRPGGAPRIALVAAAIGVTRWAVIARYVRGSVFRAQVEDYAAAVTALGAGALRLLARHLLPGALTPALVSAAFGAGSAVLLESAINFLGLGTQPPDPSWGGMIAEAAHRGWRTWWLLVAPGAAIAILVTGFNLIAEGLRLRGPGEGGAATPPHAL